MSSTLIRIGGFGEVWEEGVRTYVLKLTNAFW
jgi:hypothetical protein